MRHTLTITLSSLAVMATALGARAEAQTAPQRPPVVRQSSVQAMARGEAPSAFGARFTGPRAVRLSWSPAAGATGVAIYRAPAAGGPWTELATVPGGATSYDDATAAPGAKYAYRVAARYDGRLEGATAPAEVVMPCDKYCVGGDCTRKPKPATKLTAVEGSMGTGPQWRLTLKVTAIDAESGAPLAGTVSVNGIVKPIGTTVVYPPCRAGRATDMNAEIVPCTARIAIAGRGEMKMVTQ